MPIQFSYILTARRVIRDDYTKMFTYLDVFERLTIPKAQGHTYESFVVAGKVFDLPAGDLEMEVTIVDPNANDFVSSGLKGEISSGDAEFFVRFDSVKFEIPGRYTFKVKANSVQLDVNKNFFFEVQQETL